MPISLCSECLQEKPLTKFEGSALCKECRLNYSTNKMISELFHGKKVEKIVIAQCNANNCSNLIYNTDKPRKFLKVSGFEYFISSSETEEILLCEACYKKKVIIQKKKEKNIERKLKWLLFCGLLLSLLWLRLFYWEKIIELWNKYPLSFVTFLIVIFVTLGFSWSIYRLSKKSFKFKNKK